MENDQIVGVEAPEDTNSREEVLIRELPVDKIIRLFGDDVTLVPIQRGTKKPSTPWKKITNSYLRQKDFRDSLNKGNIAVKVGRPSGGICSIDIDDDSRVDDFLELNPKLRGTFTSKGRRGLQIWVRIREDHPDLTKLKTKAGVAWGEFRADGGLTIIYGMHPEGMMYEWIVEAPPIELTFEEIKWPDDLVLPWEESSDDAAPQNEVPDEGPDLELREKYGRPFYVSKQGSVSVNQSYWAALYAAENIVIFEPSEKRFYIYRDETGLYEPITDSKIRANIAARMLEVSKELDLVGLEKTRTSHNLTAIVDQLTGICEKWNAFATRPALVHTANGMIEVENGKIIFSEFSPDHHSRNASPVGFDPEANCERFLNELLKPALSHEDDVLLIQKMFGQFLLGQNPIQRFVILDGLPNRGKSQLADLIQLIVGVRNVSQLRTAHLSDRFELHRFMDKTLLVGVDVEKDFLAAKGAATIKGLVGGDRFDTERKYGTESYLMEGRLNLLITSNSRQRLNLQGDTGAWKRRLIIIRFNAPAPAKRIPDFGRLLVREEGSGILNWALDGLVLLQKDIDEIGDIRLTERQKQIVSDLLAESDSLYTYLEKTFERHIGAQISTTRILAGYPKFCDDRIWERISDFEAKRQLEGYMEELFQVKKSHDITEGGKAVRGFRNVRFKQKEGNRED